MHKGLEQLEICIRTFDARSALAEQLQRVCINVFHTNVHLLNTKASDGRYSEKFIFLLYNILQSSTSNYFLILEDDMIFTEDAFETLNTILAQKYSHMWFSVAHKHILDASIRISNSTYLLSNCRHIHYSGAVLVHREMLKRFIEAYLFNFQELEFRNFDVNISKFINLTSGYLILRPNVFASNPSIPSALDSASFEIQGRSFQNKSSLDPCFEFSKAHSYFGKVI